MSSIARRLLKKALHAAGFDPVPVNFSTDLDRVFRRSLRLAGSINTVIDVGASDGRWTRSAMRVLPECSFLLFEAAPFHHEDLDRFASEHPRVRVEKKAASDKEGNVHFLLDPDNPLGGTASVQSSSRHQLLPCGRIDHATKNHGLTGPYLLKLDAHGHEKSILRGAEEALAETALLIIEAYGLAGTDRMGMTELFSHMGGYGFSVAGIADAMVRPSDGILWQADVFFLRADHPAFADPLYH